MSRARERPAAEVAAERASAVGRHVLAAAACAAPSRPAEVVPVTTTTPSFQMPVTWDLHTAVALVDLAEAGYQSGGSSASGSSSFAVNASVQGYSTPSTIDVGGASLRLRLATSDLPPAAHETFGHKDGGSVVLAIRRCAEEPWLPAIAGVPGRRHDDRSGLPRSGLLEVMIIARPTARGQITFLPEDAMRAWVPEGLQVELAPLKRLGDFHIDDGSGPWLRDRICITASDAEDYARLMRPDAKAPAGGLDALLSGSGLRQEATIAAPPLDEWDLARLGRLHRDVK